MDYTAVETPQPGGGCSRLPGSVVVTDATHKLIWKLRL
jgi:hypothetical protein